MYMMADYVIVRALPLNLILTDISERVALFTFGWLNNLEIMTSFANSADS